MLKEENNVNYVLFQTNNKIKIRINYNLSFKSNTFVLILFYFSLPLPYGIRRPIKSNIFKIFDFKTKNQSAQIVFSFHEACLFYTGHFRMYTQIYTCQIKFFLKMINNFVSNVDMANNITRGSQETGFQHLKENIFHEFNMSTPIG